MASHPPSDLPTSSATHSHSLDTHHLSIIGCYWLLFHYLFRVRRRTTAGDALSSVSDTTLFGRCPLDCQTHTHTHHHIVHSTSALPAAALVAPADPIMDSEYREARRVGSGFSCVVLGFLLLDVCVGFLCDVEGFYVVQQQQPQHFRIYRCVRMCVLFED